MDIPVTGETTATSTSFDKDMIGNDVSIRVIGKSKSHNLV